MGPKFYRDERGEWRWRFKADNNYNVGDSSEGYHNLDDCMHGLDIMRQYFIQEYLAEQASQARPEPGLGGLARNMMAAREPRSQGLFALGENYLRPLAPETYPENRMATPVPPVNYLATSEPPTSAPSFGSLYAGPMPTLGNAMLRRSTS